MSTQKEFGDFQTPATLAHEVIDFIGQISPKPTRVIEPTAGLGSFIEAANARWGASAIYQGFEINPRYITEATKRLASASILLKQQDFFAADWPAILACDPGENLLVVGNPPWVTNATLGQLGSANLPAKSNFQGLRGFDARTGKSNFDIAEWILIRLIESLNECGTIAMLCKTMTARKVLRHVWKTWGGLEDSAMYLIDAKAHFGVSVDACLFYATGRRTVHRTAGVYADLSRAKLLSEIGLVDGHLVSNVGMYREHKDIDGGSPYMWRSGIKHDSSQIMEFTKENGHYKNGLNEVVSLEPDFLYPLLKSSDLGNGRTTPRRWVLVTQKNTGDDTNTICDSAPKTWTYLEEHADALDARKSSIYENRSRYSVFGIGEYAFSPWKVAISGLYKSMQFVVVPPFEGFPVMVDDTCYFVPCESESEARFVGELLNSTPSQRFLASIVFEDSKRPVTAEVLRRISLTAVAQRLGRMDDFFRYCKPANSADAQGDGQLSLIMDRRKKYLPKA